MRIRIRSYNSILIIRVYTHQQQLWATWSGYYYINTIENQQSPTLIIYH